ncbi:thiazole biosynthesis adenylyltransferase ThiF [Priestia koreensis]|uniref:thiazole biosynthesis adenylyltransferase ThiF n=1 Tax=Priestia koreensis TaxID=284581 RepID=UPI00203D4AAD|nr:thiazole biosynthesis adenylyltransferase ThiF [Priestia koreensis]MCM3004721.1 thiazole biosynthesis adenylyltransferase ThiF [Priestia koreensis]
MSSERYSRQELFTPIGKSGQEKIVSKHVLIIGAGALGTASAEALVRAGVGTVTIIDRDYVEWSNLQRQQLYTEENAERRTPKAVAAKNRLQEVNSSVNVHAHVMDGNIEELESLITQGVDVIIDATDNFDTRLIINDLAQKHQVPWVYGACVGSYGISYTILPGETPCLSCLLDTVPMGGMTCDTVGIISPAVQMVVSYQVTEVLKLLVEDKASLRKKLVSFDLWKNQHTMIAVDKVKKADCPSCGEHATYPFLAYENQTKTAVLCGRNTVQIRPAEGMKRSLDAIAESLRPHGKLEQNPYLVSLTMDEKRLVVFQDGRAFIHGTNDISEAKTIYYRYLG